MKPMLAATIKDVGELRFPLIASPKLDGVRALIVDGVVMSRNMKPIPNQHVQEMFGREEYNGFDGELVVGAMNTNDTFNRTMSAVMSHEGEPEVWYIVFDNYLLATCGYEERMAGMPTYIMHDNCWLKTIDSVTVRSAGQLRRLEKRYIEQGFEGVMLRRPDAAYKYGRSTMRSQELMKLKQFEDAEAIVVDVQPYMQNNNPSELDELGRLKKSSKKAGKVELEMLGALTVSSSDGVVFDIGSGFTSKQRLAYWLERDKLIGRAVKYKFQPAGVKDKPRFPVFIGFRHPIDL